MAGGDFRPSNGIRKPGFAKQQRQEEQVYNTPSAPVVVRTGGVRVPGQVAGREFGRKKTKIRGKYKSAVIFLWVIFLVAVVFFTAYLSYTYLVDKYNNPLDESLIEIDPETTVKFRIKKGATASDIAEELYEMGLINNKFMYKFLSKFNGYDSRYKAGTYTLCQGLSYDEIMVLLSGEPETVKVLIKEGLTTTEIAYLLEEKGVVNAQDFLHAVNTIDLSSYSFLPEKTAEKDYRLDGYLFPDTYLFDMYSTPEAVIYKMLNRFNEVFKTSFYAKSAELGLTVDQVMILASLVETEAALESEREVIAGVFYNRLKTDLKDLQYMQSASTIIYVYNKHFNGGIGTSLTSQESMAITKQYRTYDDPYNTYVYSGLMPGAICNPGLASIEAVMGLDKHDYYFFLLKNDGSGGHVFSETFEQHQAAMKEFGYE